ncbi:MAG: hypothetical protein ACRDLA_01760 [Thermoleophilaceae bacterium]
MVDRLFRAFVAEHKAGGPADPLRYLDRAGGVERLELQARIDGYLARAPRRRFDADAYAASRASGVVDTAERVLWGEAGMLPTVLPHLRKEAEITRESLVKRLAERLGVASKEAKVREYYHELEHGLIPSESVSPKVFEALGELLGRSGDWLREQGKTIAGGADPAAGPVFARTAQPAGAPAQRRPDERVPEREWDEVDELFLGTRDH